LHLDQEAGFTHPMGCNARADNIDLETLLIVKDAGCRQLTFGFESGSQKYWISLIRRRRSSRRKMQSRFVKMQVYYAFLLLLSETRMKPLKI